MEWEISNLIIFVFYSYPYIQSQRISRSSDNILVESNKNKPFFKFLYL